jgi:glucose/arabinose dehydrogenase
MRPSSRRAVAVALLAGALVASSACGGDPSTDASNGTTVGTAPVITSPGGAYGNGGTLGPPLAVPTLDGIVLKVTQIADVHEPVAFASRSGTDTLYVAQKDGRIKQIAVDKQFDRDGKLTRLTYRLDNNPILDISRSTTDQGERGLLGLAFSSDGRRLYILYTAGNGAVTVDEYRMNDDAVDRGSRRNLLNLDHPEVNHNGGQLAFGPDGYLYIGMGDGGGAGDPNKNGQNAHTLYGKILRIDPEGATKDAPYATPAGNPFKDGQLGAPEVWAFGLRNPWRFSFDKVTKDLWIGDVGQNETEEIDFLPFLQGAGGAGRGANLGWSEMEGNHPFNGGTPPAGYIPPIFDYGRGNGACSVIGGYVYRGKAMFGLLGVYLYADYCTGEIRMLLRKPDNQLDERGTGLSVPAGNLESNGSITSFGEDNDGEIFVLSALGGVYKIENGA